MIGRGASFASLAAIASGALLILASCTGAHAQAIGGGGGGAGGVCSSNPCPVTNGGTGSTTAANARAALGAAASGANSDITTLNTLSYGAHKLLIGEAGSALGTTCAPAAGQLIVGQGATLDPACETVTGDGALSAAGALSVASVAGQTPAQFFGSPPAAGYGATTPEPVHATTINATGLISPTDGVGIKGQITGANPQPGSDGEYLSATSGAISLTSSTAADTATITLTAGDWDVTGVVQYSPAGSTIMNSGFCGVSTVANTLPVLPFVTSIQMTHIAGVGEYLACPVMRFNVTSSTTARLEAFSFFSTSTMTATGFIRARRVD